MKTLFIALFLSFTSLAYCSDSTVTNKIEVVYVVGDDVKIFVPGTKCEIIEDRGDTCKVSFDGVQIVLEKRDINFAE